MAGAKQRNPEAFESAPSFAVTDVIRISRAFSRAECREVISLRDALDKGGDRFLNYGEIRGASEVCWLPLAQTPKWLKERLDELMQSAIKGFDFDISGPQESLKLIKYRPGNRVQWHVDCGGGATNTRKLTLTVLLSPPDEFEGGELKLATAHTELHRDIGDAVIFPAFLVHKVSTVKRGARHVLVTWAHGPRFR